MGISGVERLNGVSQTSSQAADQPRVYATKPRTIFDQESREKAEYDVRVDYYRQRLDGDLNISDKEIKEAAERYVEDKKVQEDFENTELFMDKEKYKAAEKARKAERKKLIEQYRAEGLSKREAADKADAQLVENKYLKKGLRIFGVRIAGGRPRKAVEKMMADSQMQAKITDENGEFSSDKTKDVLLGVSNFNNGDSKHAREALGASKQKISHEEYNDYVERWSKKTNGDTEAAKELLKEAGIAEPQADYVNQKTNHRISVNESEAASKKLEQDGVDISARQLRRLGKKANLSVEGDKAPYIKAATATALAYAGHELIPPIVSKSGSASSSASEAIAKNGGAEAGAEAAGYGAAGASAKVRVGGFAGALGFLFGGAREKDHVIPELKYNKKPETPEKPEKPEKPVTPETPETPETPDVCVPQKDEVTETVQVKNETCPVILKKGQTLYDAARDRLGNTVMVNGKPADSNPSQTHRLTTAIKASYGLRPSEADYARTEWNFPTEFEGKQLDCDATIHGTGRYVGKANLKNNKKGNYTEQTHQEQRNNFIIRDCNGNEIYRDTNRQRRDEMFDSLTK